MVYQLHIHNRAPIPLSLENRSDKVFSNSANQFHVPARGEATIDIAELKSTDSLEALKMAVLNAFREPDKAVVIEVRRQAD